MTEPRAYDNVIVGGGLSGLATAYLLSNFGHRVLLLEKSTALAGISGSFQDQLGNTFDFGYHALDYGRSHFTTQLFLKLLKGRARVFPLSRGIVVEGNLIAYNALPPEWPDGIRAGFPAGVPTESLSTRPTRAEISRVYGARFAELIFGQALRSYPSLLWQLEHGATEPELLDTIYPWFFPRAELQESGVEEWNRYHDLMRATNKQMVIYPQDGGFGEVLTQMVEQSDPAYLEVRRGVKQIDYSIDRETRAIRKITVEGQEISPSMVYWCAPVGALSGLFGVQLPAMQSQEFVLGSFAAKNELSAPYHELLVGDPDHLINRISFPGLLSGRRNHLIQAEFIYPHGQYSLSATEWRDRFWQSFQALGLVEKDNEIEAFDFKKMKKGFLTREPYPKVLDLIRQGVAHPDSNVRVPFWGLGPENINRVLPSVFENVMTFLCRESRSP